MLVDMTIKEFLAEITSDSPAPGGGSVAALAGAVGAALATMVGNLTLSNAKYREVQSEVEALMPHLNSLQAKLVHYVDEDTAAFNQVMAAYRLPKGTDEEKQALEKLYHLIQLNPEGKAFLENQMKFQQMMSDIMKIINESTVDASRVLMEKDA